MIAEANAKMREILAMSACQKKVAQHSVSWKPKDKIVLATPHEAHFITGVDKSEFNLLARQGKLKFQCAAQP